jgi:adenylate cyclase
MHRLYALESNELDWGREMYVVMAVEIERKFLVASALWQASVVSMRRIKQGYLSGSGPANVRVRFVENAGDTKGFLTIKSAEAGCSRQEFEYAIPSADAEQLLGLCQGAIIDKTRHNVQHEGQLWEVDVFLGDNEGLIVAEIELERADQDFEHPPWLGEEITEDHRYYNAELAQHPFSSW